MSYRERRDDMLNGRLDWFLKVNSAMKETSSQSIGEMTSVHIPNGLIAELALSQDNKPKRLIMSNFAKSTVITEITIYEYRKASGVEIDYLASRSPITTSFYVYLFDTLTSRSSSQRLNSFFSLMFYLDNELFKAMMTDRSQLGISISFETIEADVIHFKNTRYPLPLAANLISVMNLMPCLRIWYLSSTKSLTPANIAWLTKRKQTFSRNDESIGLDSIIREICMPKENIEQWNVYHSWFSEKELVKISLISNIYQLGKKSPGQSIASLGEVANLFQYAESAHLSVITTCMTMLRPTELHSFKLKYPEVVKLEIATASLGDDLPYAKFLLMPESYSKINRTSLLRPLAFSIGFLQTCQTSLANITIGDEASVAEDRMIGLRLYRSYLETPGLLSTKGP